MSLYNPSPRLRTRQKLGLSLAGGGFRASLFHIGVLLRLAEMDVLRYVEVLSTVSGGSIVGALYALMLKQGLDAKSNLSRNEYVELVKSLRDTFVKGVKKDLRTRLFMNPFGIFSILVSHDSLGRRMGRIYQRCIYRETVNALNLDDRNWLSRWLWPGWMSLPKLRFKQPMPQGIEHYNAEATKSDGSAVTQLIMNATALNSGAPFRLSSNEIGDPRLGYFRYDEIIALRARKQLLELATLEQQATAGNGFNDSCNIHLSARAVDIAQWWIDNKEGQNLKRSSELTPLSARWSNLDSDNSLKAAYIAMCRTNFGRLRQLKLPAWYVLKGYTREEGKKVTGGYSEKDHRARFIQVLEEVEPTLTSDFFEKITEKTSDDLLEFALEIYYLRSAEVMSWRIKRDFQRISLGTAAAASANFPPVFTPLVLLGIYDDLHVSRLGLSDGGVYDNMGIDALIEEGCTHIIASDTSAPFEVQQRLSPGYVGMIGRLPDILTDDVADQQRLNLRTRARLNTDLEKCLAQIPSAAGARDELQSKYGLDGLAFFSVESLNPSTEGGIDLGKCEPQQVACLRTDLDAFGEIEISALINTGYDHADRFMKAYLAKPPYKKAHWDDRIEPPCLPNDRYNDLVPRVLEVGQSRFFRSLKIRSFRCAPSWLAIGGAIALLVYFGQSIWSLQNLIKEIPNAILGWLEDPLPLFTHLERWFPPLTTFSAWLKGWIVWALQLDAPLWILVLAPVLLLLVIFLGWPLVTKSFRTSRSPAKRKFVTGFKWARAFAPALFLIAGLTPVWLTAVAFVVGWVSFLFFNLPFRWATKMD
jgi:predicted acylesterase/phospholipase RssA